MQVEGGAGRRRPLVTRMSRSRPELVTSPASQHPRLLAPRQDLDSSQTMEFLRQINSLNCLRRSSKFLVDIGGAR